MSSLTVQPLLPPALWLMLLIGTATMLAFYALRRPAVVRVGRWLLIIAMMGISVALVLLLLLNPQWVTPIPPPEGRPSLTILLDTSASMATADAQDHSTRLGAASNLVAGALPRLKGKFDVQLVSFSDIDKPVADTTGLQPTGMVTDLAAALRPYVKEGRTQGSATWLLSDGIPTSPGGLSELDQAVRTARTQDVPVYTSVFGTSHQAADLAIDLRYQQDMAFVNQQATLTAQLHHVGLAFRQVSVGLYARQQLLSKQTITLPQSGAATVSFPVTEKTPGIWTYEVRAEPLPEETVVSNNSALYVLKVVDKPIRVLVLEGKPYWDSKFLVQTLCSIPAFRVDSYVRVNDSRYIGRTMAPGSVSATRAAEQTWQILRNVPGVLADPAQLGEYQIMVLGREAEAFLTPAAIANIQQWVSREGGSLLCYRGAPAAVMDDRLQRLMPVSWVPVSETHYAPRITEAGRQMRWLSLDGDKATMPAEMPLLAIRQKPENAKPLAVVVASINTGGEDVPAFVYQPYGAGRVVVIEGSGMWRWAFAPPQERQRESIYESLWQGSMRWLISGGGLQPGQQRLLRADNTVFRPGETVAATMLVRPQIASGVQPRIVLLRAEGTEVGRFTPQAFGDDLGVFRIEFGKLSEGGYRAAIDDASGKDPASQIAFEVRDPGEEKLDLNARPDLMAQIARNTGGQVIEAGQNLSIEDAFTQHQISSRPTRLERITAWDRGWILISALGLWCVSWGLRRHWGLL